MLARDAAISRYAPPEAPQNAPAYLDAVHPRQSDVSEDHVRSQLGELARQCETRTDSDVRLLAGSVALLSRLPMICGIRVPSTSR